MEGAAQRVQRPHSRGTVTRHAPQQRGVLPQQLLQVDGAVHGFGRAAAPRVVPPVPQALQVRPLALRAGVAQSSEDPASRREGGRAEKK